MGTDVYTSQVRAVENQIAALESTTNYVNADLFYDQYPNITDSKVAKEYKEGTVDYISLPKKSLGDPEVRKYLLGRIAKKPETFLSKHALETHPKGSRLATKILYHQAVKNPNNLSSDTRTPKTEKKQEATRVTLSTHKPVELPITRHLHLQMALELVQQIREGKTQNHVIQKSLRKLAQTSPGYATTICCILRYYSPRINNLQMGYEDIFNTVAQLKQNRYEDRKIVQDIANELEQDSNTSKDDIPSEKKIANVVNIIEERFPKEKDKLNTKGKFREKVYPYLILESAYNIIQNLCKKSGVSFDSKFAKQLPPKLEETVTCKIVTAYLRHIPRTSLGPTSIMLTEEKLSEFRTSSTTSFTK
jgi:hypothetical protein